MVEERRVTRIGMALAEDLVNHPRSRHTAIGTLNLGGAGSRIMGRMAPRVRNVLRGIERLMGIRRIWC